MPAVRCKCKSGCRIVDRILVIRLSECADTLEQFKLRSTAASVIAVNLDLIAQLKQDICKPTVCTETDDPRTALSRAAEDVDQFQLMLSLVDAVDLDLIDAVVNCTQVFVVRCRTYTVYMWTEVTLCNASKSLVINTIHDTSETSVAACMYNRHLAVMVSCHIQIFAVHVCCQETSSHSVDADSVNAGQVTVLVTFEHCHTFVLDGIQKLAILGNCRMRCIADLYFAPFFQSTFLNIYIVNLNTFTVAVGICSHIGYIFLIPHDIAS